jgi:hypothetical protein
VIEKRYFCCNALGPKVAQSGHVSTTPQCPLSEVKRTSGGSRWQTIYEYTYGKTLSKQRAAGTARGRDR